MAAGAIFGALSGLANLGEQKAEASQIASDEIVRRLLQKQQTQAFRTQQQEAAERMREGNLRQQETSQRLLTGKQLIPLGTAFVSGGKQFQRFQNPLTGEISIQELAGPIPETPEEQMNRALTAIGYTEADRRDIINRKFGGKLTEDKLIEPDPNSYTGFSAVRRDEYGNKIWSVPALPPRFMAPTETTGTTTDPATGLTTTRTNIRRPLIPGVTGPVALPSSIPRTVPSGGASGAPGSGQATIPAANLPKPQGAPVTGPGTAPGGPIQPAAGPMNVGPFRGLDAQGEIPPRPGLPDPIRQYANDILTGRDVSKIPQRLRGLAESWARAYGWKGQGSLTPAQQMQIQQVDNSLRAISTPEVLKLFDSPWAVEMSTLPVDPKTEGGFTGLIQALQRKAIPQEYADYMDKLIRLRGVIAGIRGFTGANNSNATADRLLAELPNFNNTKNGQDAATKLSQLRTEISIIKRLGYFVPDDQAPQPQAQPADQNAPPPGAKVRDFSQLGP